MARPTNINWPTARFMHPSIVRITSSYGFFLGKHQKKNTKPPPENRYTNVNIFQPPNQKHMKTLFFSPLLATVFLLPGRHILANSPEEMMGPDIRGFLAEINRLAELTDPRIPRSIVMAQVCKETGYGTSELSKNAHNYFGLKYKKGWQGEVYRKNDDCGDSACLFRKYRSPEESFRDYGAFLNRPLYAFLFQLRPGDYRSWAKGLKMAGYATNCHFDTDLIEIIEKHRLYEFDRDRTSFLDGRSGQYLLVLGNIGETLGEIASAQAIPVEQLSLWNEVPTTFRCPEATFIWLCPKSEHYRDCEDHIIVAYPANLHGISQQLGVKVAVLQRLNPHVPEHAVLPEGYRLVLK
jgi:hypothetical protein